MAASDVTPYEDIDDDLSLDFGNNDTWNRMRNRPLPAPPRPPRDKKQRQPSKSRRTDDDDKFDRGGGGERLSSPYLDDSSRISSQEVDEAETGTQTDPLPVDYSFEEFEITDDMPRIAPSSYNNNHRHSKTIEELLREDQEAELERARQLATEQNLVISLSKFREASQRTYSERSRTSGGSRGSRPITPSAIVVETRIIRSTDATEGAMLVASADDMDLRQLGYRTDSKDSEDVVDVDDHITTEDERIVSEAIRRYQLLDPQFKESSSQPSASSSRHDLEAVEADVVEDAESVPLPPPRRKSSAIVETQAADVVEDKDVVEEKLPEPSTEIAAVDLQPVQPAEEETITLVHRGRLQIDELEVNSLNVRALQAGRILVSDLQGASITTDELECRSGNITVRGIELPIDFIRGLVDQSTARAAEIVDTMNTVSEEPVVTSPQSPEPIEPVAPIQPIDTTNVSPLQQEPQPPARPPPPSFFPSDYEPYSIPPPSFYQLRNPESDEEIRHLHSMINAQQRPRPRPHRHRHDSTSEEEYQRNRRHRHRHDSHGAQSPTEQRPSILDLSGQLVRACGAALGQSLQNASNTVWSVVQTVEPNDEKRRNINLVLIILIVILAVLMIMGLTDRNVHHHHHWDFLNPPKNSGL